MDKFFKLKENKTNVNTEITAGLTTFFAMAYIIVVNPGMLSATGMPWGGAFFATIIAAIIGTLVMGLFANVPYAQAPGMGLNAFFTFTVCSMLKFKWQEALAMVFICGIINVIITVTKLRKSIIKSIPTSLQHAIGGGIGIFVAYVGLKGANLFTFNIGGAVDASGNAAGSIVVPSFAALNNKALWLAVGGILLTIVLVLLKVKGAILIGIVATALVGIPLGVTAMQEKVNSFGDLANSFSNSLDGLGTTFGAAFGKDGMGSLFSDPKKIPTVLLTILSFSLSDTFDTIGTFIGTGRRTGIFDEADEKALQESSGFKSKMDKALFADSIATSVGAVFGTSNTTTYVESAAGIAAGGRTGLTSVVVAICFAISALFAPFVAAIPSAATAPALLVVGIMMMASFKEIKWDDFSEALPAFGASIFMALSYNISDGIAVGFIFYIITMACKKKIKEIHPILWVATILFILNFVIRAVL